MKKKSRKKIPQDVKPWSRVKNVDEDILSLPAKKTSRWVAGGRRDWDAVILNITGKYELSRLILKSLKVCLGSSKANFAHLLMQKLSTKNNGNKIMSLSRYKNFCLFTGRSRTYNRSLYMARHNMRKLVGLGAISGLLK